jgi:hypothetical protein
MPCSELERRESRLIEIRTAQRKPDLSEEQRESLVSAEVHAIMDIKEHQAAGHNGQPCPG